MWVGICGTMLGNVLKLMVGLGGLEPPTSPLSVLRSLPPAPSNHPGRYISSIMDFYLRIGVRKWGRTATHEPPSLQVLFLVVHLPVELFLRASSHIHI
jgi:hypothetical protein